MRYVSQECAYVETIRAYFLSNSLHSNDRKYTSSVLTDSTFSGHSQRSKEALEQVQRLLSTISDENSIDIFDAFSQKLMDALEWTYSNASCMSTGEKNHLESSYGGSFIPLGLQNCVRFGHLS